MTGFDFSGLLGGLLDITWQQLIMVAIGLLGLTGISTCAVIYCPEFTQSQLLRQYWPFYGFYAAITFAGFLIGYCSHD